MKMSDEEFKKFMQTDIGKSIEPYFDSRATAAVQTYQKNHPSIIDEDQLKIKLDKIEADANRRELELTKTKLDSHLFKQCTIANVSYDLLKDFVFDNTDSIDAKVEQFAQVVKGHSDNDINNLLAKNSFVPHGGRSLRERETKATLTHERACQLEELGVLDGLSDH